MPQTTHTPGPWTIRDGGFIDGKGFFCLATVRAAHVPNEPEAIANARLIAAAPDMLAVLKVVLACPQATTALARIGTGTRTGVDYFGGEVWTSNAFEDLCAAIAKAEG